MVKENALPAGELTDEQILAAIAAAPKVSPKYAGWVRDQRILYGRAIIAADRALRASQTVTIPPIEKLSEIVGEHLTCVYMCGRSWSAWGVGTMTQDDFTEAQDTELPDDIATAIYASLIEGNQALRASPAAGDAAMPVKAHAIFDEDGELIGCNDEPGQLNGIPSQPLVWEADARAALAAKDAEIARLKSDLARPESLAVGLMRAEIATLTAERDHWKANHDAQVQQARLLIDRVDMPVERVKAYALVTRLTAERDALKDELAKWQKCYDKVTGWPDMTKDTK